MENLYLLTEERAKPKVIIEILKIYCNEFNKNMEIIGDVKIIPEINNQKHSFNSYLKGVKIEDIEQIILSSASGKSSFVDYLVFEQSSLPEKNNDNQNNLVLMIEETKTSDKESRNTGVYQRSLKFVYADVFYPDVKKYMLYNIEGEHQKPTKTCLFGTNMLLNQKVGVTGKDIEHFKEFDDIDEVIAFKDSMRPPPRGNVPVNITINEDIITISGRLSKPKNAGNIAHDPNMGCLSSIAKTLRVLDWKGKIIITHHGVKQEYIDRTRGNKFLNIATHLDVHLEGITFDISKNIPTTYWYYEKSSEKIGTIFLHLLAVNLDDSVKSIYENHAGCERGYFYLKNGKGIALPKKDTNGLELRIPDLILMNNDTEEILVIEGKKSSTLDDGLREIKNYDPIEKEYIIPRYPNYSISRWVTTFGEDIYYGKLNSKVLMHLNTDGSFYVNENAPNWIKELFKDNTQILEDPKELLKDGEKLIVNH